MAEKNERSTFTGSLTAASGRVARDLRRFSAACRRPAFALALLAQSLPACAAGWTVKARAVNGGQTFSQSLNCAEGKPAEFSGRPAIRGYGPVRDMVFRATLRTGDDGLLRLEYDLTMKAERGPRPPLQLAGVAPLRPGKPVLAAASGGWKLTLELTGSDGGEHPKPAPGRLEARLKCGRRAYAADFVFLPEKQYSAVLQDEEDDKAGKFMVGLLPGAPGLNGEFLLQYTLLLKDGAEALAEGQGKFILEPGVEKRAAAGRNCSFTVKAAR